MSDYDNMDKDTLIELLRISDWSLRASRDVANQLMDYSAMMEKTPAEHIIELQKRIGGLETAVIKCLKRIEYDYSEDAVISA